MIALLSGGWQRRTRGSAAQRTASGVAVEVCTPLAVAVRGSRATTPRRPHQGLHSAPRQASDAAPRCLHFHAKPPFPRAPLAVAECGGLPYRRPVMPLAVVLGFLNPFGARNMEKTARAFFCGGMKSFLIKALHRTPKQIRDELRKPLILLNYTLCEAAQDSPLVRHLATRPRKNRRSPTTRPLMPSASNQKENPPRTHAAPRSWRCRLRLPR